MAISPSDFAQTLRRFRLRAGFSQEELAESASISARAVSDMERGIRRNPRPESLRLLAKALALDDDERELFFETAHPTERPLPIDPGDISGQFERGAFPPPALYPLPLPPDALIGRQLDIEAIVALLESEPVRLVTLTGPGGVGKTRLGLAAGKRMTPAFASGAVFVDLAPLSTPEQVVPAILAALGLTGDPRTRPLDALRGALRSQELLLVLDNFEHLADAAPLLADILAETSSVKMLVTSRMRLNLRGEHSYPVAPLAVPPEHEALGEGRAADLAQYSSVRLFLERARQADYGFVFDEGNASDIAQVCRRLDGLPLAIELVAARVALLPPVSLLARLESMLPLLTDGARDAPARQRTMRDAIAWSYDLLSPEEQRFFQQLSVCAGGFTLEAAAHLTGAALGETVEGLANLVAKCLLRQEERSGGESRYRMLEPVREFGLERLSGSERESAVRDAHANWCLAFAERAGRAFARDDQAVWLARMEIEFPNMRAAFAWLLTSGDPNQGMWLAASLGDYWWLRGDPFEGRSWLERSLGITAHTVSAVRASAELCLANIYWALGSYDEAAELGANALATFRTLGQADGVAAALLSLGRVASDSDDPRAESLYRESLRDYRALGNARDIIRCLSNLGLVMLNRRDLDQAAVLEDEALALARDQRLEMVVAIISRNRACIAYRQKDFQRAIALHRESLERCAALRLRRFVAENLQGLAMVAAEMGAAEDAVRLAGADEAVRETIGAPLVRYEKESALVQRGLLATLGARVFSDAWAAGRGPNADAAIAGALEIAARLEQQVTDRAEVPHGLTHRELEVLKLLIAGRSNPEIGETLFISPRTAQTHVTNILAKLGASSRTEAATIAIREGIV